MRTSARSRGAQRPPVLEALALAGLLAAPIWLPWFGTALVATDPPAPADAIVVLAGNSPERLQYAEALWRAGCAPILVVSNEAVHTYGLDTTWLDLYHAQVAAPDLPLDVVLALDPPPENTIDEARRAAALLASRGVHRALLVTDAYHSRRASLLFAAQFRHRGLEVRSTPVLESDPDLAHWWTSPLEARRVAEEWTKLIAYLFQGAYF